MRKLFAISAALLVLVGCRAQLHHGLDEAEANGIQNALRDHGIESKKVQEKGKKPTYAIEVDESVAADAQRILTELELPRPRLDGLAAMSDSASVVPTATEEHLRKVKALSEEVALTLQSVDGVTSARVLLALPPPPRPGQVPSLPKASAFLRVRPGAIDRLEPMRADLSKLVAGSVEGLSSEQVTVVLQEISRPNRAAPQEAGAGRHRFLLLALGLTVAGLLLGLVFLTLRLRSLSASLVQTPAGAPASPRPSVSPSATRKAA